MAMAMPAQDTPGNYDPEKPNHMIFWLDASIGNPKEYVHLKKAFGSNTDPRQKTWTMLTDRDYDNLLAVGDAVSVIFEGVVFLLQAFNNEKDCLEAFEQNQDKRIFFITSGSMGESIVPKIVERYRHIFTDLITDEPYQSVYVFCHSIELNLVWAINYLEYIQMFNFDSELLERMTRDIAQYFIERGKRIRTENDREGALKHLHWAKILWHQYDKMQQQIATDDPRPVGLSVRMREINELIKQFEELPNKSTDPDNPHSDDETKGCESSS